MQRKGPLPGKIFARCILQRRFAGLFGCMARESCRELAIFPSEATFGMHGAKKLPRIDARERTAAKSCHGKALENASRENIATASQAKSASGRNPATVGRWGGRTSREYCHVRVARERISRISCHRRAPGNTSMKNLHNRHLTIVYKTLTRNQAEYNKEIGF